MKDIEKKRLKEKKVVGLMIDLYCKDHHGKKLCKQCQELKEYAWKRSDLCPFMKNKTFCVNCKIHCYQKEKRIQIQEVMRYSGKRMIFYHPILAISHAIEMIKERKKLK